MEIHKASPFVFSLICQEYYTTIMKNNKVKEDRDKRIIKEILDNHRTTFSEKEEALIIDGKIMEVRFIGKLSLEKKLVKALTQARADERKKIKKKLENWFEKSIEPIEDFIEKL